ncbi:MAG TPA: hypothetical protein PKL08_08040 [Thermoanaerobaculaceae bacterium]|nr:hypothetical protein [Thermoanaerobaculaceae bacterium]
MSTAELLGWDRLRHGGLLLDPPRLGRIAEYTRGPLAPFDERELRKQSGAVLDGGAEVAAFVAFVLERICGFLPATGSWQRGSQIGAEWGRRAVTGETVKPRQLWRRDNGAILPVFLDTEPRLGIGRGRRSASQTIQWLRAGSERLAVLTNGRQWRLIFAGLDFDAWCEWDLDLWFEEGALSSQVAALRTLLQPALWTPPAPGTPSALLEAILDSRKGQAELSAALGERVREAVELLVQAHGEILKEQCADIDPAEVYRAAVRVVMRMVVVLFAESRELLPRESAFYHGAYGLTGLLEELEKVSARGGNRLARSWNAWPRVLALFRLVHQGSHHPALPVPAYGGELFAPGDPAANDGVSRALTVFENACFDRELLSDRDVHRMLERITRTRVKLRQGRASTWVPSPVDFSDLSSEYIGILYEGLLDFELRTAPAADPVIFLAVGNQPALPLSRLEAMDDKALADLLEKMKDTSTADADQGDETEASGDDEAATAGEETAEDETPDEGTEAEAVDEAAVGDGDRRHQTRTRAEQWARRAVIVGRLAHKPKGALTAQKRVAYEDAIARKARQLVTRVILPHEWYVVRWGGTRKGSGTFYTRPGLAVPTVQRTLRPLAYTPPSKLDGTPDLDAPAAAWTPKTPEEILALKVCDGACGSGTFPVAALRFLTEALYASLHHHGRITADGARAVVRLLASAPAGTPEEHLGHELLPCRPDDPLFEPRLKAILRRHVVERCIYGVDVDPLAVELCRLALWIETMDRSLPFSFLDHKIKCGNALAGAWFDQFQHYPVMAWKNRDGGDKNHTNGVHFEKEARTKAIKAFVKDTLTPDLRQFLAGRTLFSPDFQEEAAAVHSGALTTLARLHGLPVHDSAERARIYREELLGSPAYRSLKDAMDLWCACWFWPADELAHAPLPTTLAAPSGETRAIARRIAAARRFFHWELEFPDVFRAPGAGFDAMLGNPPWDTLQPNSKEFFSNIDPLYRAYGKQEALHYQTQYFSDSAIEYAWLAYTGGFADDSNWVKFAAAPFGDPASGEDSQDRFSVGRGKDSETFHERWRSARRGTRGFADPEHPFRHRGEGKAYTYKLFLEEVHALLRVGGRLGLIVPSGLYSDHGTGGLRRLFLDHCRWEWLFGFENRDGIFAIHRSFKFNPVIIEKGSSTLAIRTAFMRRALEDWERAEQFVTPYTRAQVDRFSPRSKAILEIQSARDLEILEKIYTNSVLLGDDGPDGWGIKYAQGDFNMTSDSKLFPPRPKWEADGYRPDEYSRWLKGDWRPIGELWAELGVDPSDVVPIDPACEAEIAARGADVQRTSWRRRCAQPPYDALPIPRASIPEGIILSRGADGWIREERIDDAALPLWQGVMIYGLSTNAAAYQGGAGHRAQWLRHINYTEEVLPQFLLRDKDLPAEKRAHNIGFRALSNATNERTFVTGLLDRFPCGNSVGILTTERGLIPQLFGTAISGSFVFDWILRQRIVGTNVNSFFLWESPWPIVGASHGAISKMFEPLALCGRRFSPLAVAACLAPGVSWRRRWIVTTQEITRARSVLDAVCASVFGLVYADLVHLLTACDHPTVVVSDQDSARQLNPKGFWRADKDKDPELRHTVLTLVAFHDLEEKIRACGGDRDKGIEAFLAQNNGEGWMLPETLRLADYGLGHDDRAQVPQPVASHLGPRFYDWQLAQAPEESWRECHLHARNLLGPDGYRHLLAEINAEAPADGPASSKLAPESRESGTRPTGQLKLFE